MRVASPFLHANLYSGWLGPAEKLIVRLTASRKLICPSMLFAQVGEFAKTYEMTYNQLQYSLQSQP
jgi:hypothetical protein